MAAPPPDWSELTEHSRGLSKLAASLLSDFHGGEDLAQEAVLRTLIVAPSTANPRNRTAWLRATVRNLAANEWRGRARRSEREASVARPEAVPSSEEIIERAESSRRIMDALDALPEPYGRALRDRYIGGLTAGQMAARDELSVHTVRSRIQRGKSMLRASLESLDSSEGSATPHWSVAFAPLAAPALGTGSGPVAAVSSGLLSTLGISTLMKMLAVLTACALAGWFVSKVVTPSVALPPGLNSGETIETAELATPAPPVAPQAVSAGPSRVEIAPRVSQAGGGALETTVTGVVVDPSEAPIEGVHVAWEGWVWSARERTLMRTASVTTDANGRYSADLAYEPGSTWHANIKGTRFKMNASLEASDSERADLSALEPGAVEAPRIVLQPAGAASGRVVDERGDPIAGALVRLSPSKDRSAYGLLPESETTSNADGRFVLGHVSLGILGISVASDGRTTAYLPAVNFEQDVTADVGDIALHTSKHIAGTIVDENGDPIEAQKVRAYSLEKHNVNTVAKTDAAGQFDLALKSHATHRLTIERKGYVPVGSLGSEPIELSPGTDDLRFQLEPLPLWTFRVVDAQGDPIERFGLEKILNGGSEATRRVGSTGWPTRQGLHPGGIEVSGARAGDDLIRLRAEGYLPYESDVTPDLGADQEQTIRLSRGATARGRVMSEGLPLAGATVTALDSQRHGERQELSAESNEEGLYELRGLSPGTVTVTARSGNRKRTGTTNIQIGNDLFVGPGQAPEVAIDDLNLQGAGSIEGTVLVPSGVEPEGLHVYVGYWGEATLFPVLTDGSFVITDVQAGVRGVSLTERPGAVDKLPPMRVEVREGEVSQVQIDATEHGVARVDLTIEVPGYAPEEVGVNVLHGLLDPVRRPTARNGVLPFCDSQGKVTLWSRASGIAHLELHLPDAWMTLLEPEIALTSGSVLSQHVVVDLGSIEVELPNEVDLDSGSSGWLQLYASNYHHALASWQVRSANDENSFGSLVPKDGICIVRPVQVGAFELELKLFDASYKESSSRRLPVIVKSGATTKVSFR